MQRGQTPMFAREIIYTPYFYLQKRNHVGSINEFSLDTPLPDWQDDQAQELGHAVYWVHFICTIRTILSSQWNKYLAKCYMPQDWHSLSVYHWSDIFATEIS
jgi:hypothetical protein